MKKNRKIVGILGKGEIGSAIFRICSEAGYKVLVRELAYDEFNNTKLDYLHVNIPEKSNKKFIKNVTNIIIETSPKLTIINSSITPGTTRKIYNLTHKPLVHSPVIGLHPNLYISIKKIFPKVVAPINNISLKIAKEHFKKLKLKIVLYDRPEESETAKLLDLVYYAWNIIYCKWVFKTCNKLNLNFDQVYTTQNTIYNEGFKKILPQVIRPTLTPIKGPITGHCTIPDTILFHKFYPNNLTKFIIEENNKLSNEVVDPEKERTEFIKNRLKILNNNLS